MDPVFLIICLIQSGAVNEECQVYELQPNWEMTQEILDRKVELICDNAKLVTIAHGSELTRCEVLEDVTS